MSKLSQVLTEKKIDRRRLIAASRQLEALRLSDRMTRLTRRLARRDGGKAPEGLTKGRSGRPVTGVLLDKIEAGKAVPAAAKTRILRAVNAILEVKKASPVAFKDLF